MRQISGREAKQRKRGRPVAVISPHGDEMTEKREAAIEQMIAVMNEPLIASEEFRRYSRDEMHER